MLKNIYKPAVFWGSHRWPVCPQIQSFLYPVLLIRLLCRRCLRLNCTAAPALRPLQAERAKSHSELACEPRKQTKRTVYNNVKMPLRPLVRVWNYYYYYYYDYYYCTIPLAVGGPQEKFLLAPGNNQNTGFVELTQNGEKTRSKTIHRMHKWPPINYSFIFVLISLTSLVSMRKIQKNFHTKTRLVSLISIYIKE